MNRMEHESVNDIVRRHAQPVEDLVECYRIAYGNEAVNKALRKVGKDIMARIAHDATRRG